MAERGRVKVLRQGSNRKYFFCIPNQNIFVAMLEPPQRADNIPDVGTDTEIRNPANINRNLHRMI